MLWVAAFFVTIAVVMVGIRKWKTANDPLYALDERSRKAWERESGEKLAYRHEFEDDDLTTNPAYYMVPGNAYHDDPAVNPFISITPSDFTNFTEE